MRVAHAKQNNSNVQIPIRGRPVEILRWSLVAVGVRPIDFYVYEIFHRSTREPAPTWIQGRNMVGYTGFGRLSPEFGFVN